MVSGIEFIRADEVTFESDSWMEDIYEQIERATGLQVYDLENKDSGAVIEQLQRARLHAAQRGADEVLRVLTQWLEVAKQAAPGTACHVI